MTPVTSKKMRWLAMALTAEDLRALAIECRMLEALISDHHDALRDRIELRINEVAKVIAGQSV